MDDGSEILSRCAEVMGLRRGATLRLMHRHGRILCALPADDCALALRTLALYCPQRVAGKIAVAAVGASLRLGAGRFALPECFSMNGGSGTLSECGFLIGSPAHVIKRAVAILPGASGCEVAKIAFGDDGRMALEKEAEMLRRLQGRATGAPILTGIDTRDGATVMKMPYDEGRPYHKTALNPILKLLMRWLTGTQQAFYDFRMEG